LSIFALLLVRNGPGRHSVRKWPRWGRRSDREWSCQAWQTTAWLHQLRWVTQLVHKKEEIKKNDKRISVCDSFTNLGTFG